MFTIKNVKKVLLQEINDVISFLPVSERKKDEQINK